MEIRKKGDSFIKFEWKKIILPIILIIFFSYQIFIFSSVSNKIENYLCDASEFSQEVQKLTNENNTEQLNKTITDWLPKAKKFDEDLKETFGSEAIYIVSEKINPFFPFPCEVIATNYCRYYINEESFNCMCNLNSEMNNLFEVSTPEYKKISIFIIIIHLTIIFIIGYLISAIILFIFRKLKKKDSSLVNQKITNL